MVSCVGHVEIMRTPRSNVAKKEAALRSGINRKRKLLKISPLLGLDRGDVCTQLVRKGVALRDETVSMATAFEVRNLRLHSIAYFVACISTGANFSDVCGKRLFFFLSPFSQYF